MATNPTNSTTVNIRNLPTSQLAVDSDDFILQTNNGTQIISFKDLNVVKTDINGNATVVGTITGTNAIFTRGILTPSLTASQFVTTNGQTGFTPPFPTHDYYDSFTLANGLIVSATRTISDFTSNPMYTSLYTQLTAASASLATRQRIYDYTHNDTGVKISAGTTKSNLINWPGAAPSLTTLPANVVKPSSFIISPNGDSSTPPTGLSATGIPYIVASDIIFTPATNTLQYKISTTLSAAADAFYNARLLVIY
jgi:hypothetical protein